MQLYLFHSHRKECAKSYRRSERWCHKPRSSEKQSQVISHTNEAFSPLNTIDYIKSLHSQTYLKSNPFSWDIMTDYQLMSTLPLEEEASGCAVWQAGFVVPHQITTKKITVNARVQSSIQQKRVIFRSVAVIQEKQCTVSNIPFMLSE